MGAGRKAKFKTAAALEKEVERYFRSISRTITATDENGIEVFNDDGEPIRVTEYVRPPTISALCLFLGIDRKTWQHYCNGEEHPEFIPTTTRTRVRMESYLEEELLRRRKGVQGVIFNLQNNYGWREKKELGLDAETRKELRGELSMEEKLELIAEAAREYAGEGGADGQH